MSAAAGVLAAEVWRPLAREHADRVDALSAAHRQRRRRGEKHPVEDFLWTYYSLRPGEMRRWHPGADRVLADADERLDWRYHTAVPGGVGVDIAAFMERRGAGVAFVARLLAATRGRPPQWSCFGLHEWAMVYRSDATRHPWPLRLGADGTDAVVEAHTLRCTHADAYRFFTDAARPRNAGAPQRADQADWEQPGCLHAGMDLYKWAYKLLPAVSSTLVMDAFVLARDARLLDMRSAPYDLTALGVDPIPIETAEGKAIHVAEQRRLAERAEPLRARLEKVCWSLLGEHAPTAR